MGLGDCINYGISVIVFDHDVVKSCIMIIWKKVMHCVVEALKQANNYAYCNLQM